MATKLQTPTINAITPFDPSIEYTFSFTYDGDQIVRNKAIIKDNVTNLTVYDSTNTTMRLGHTIPANTLSSGKQYIIQIQVFDIDSNSSNLSSPVLFYCFSMPTFEFENIKSGAVHKSANITLALNYTQKESEPLKSFQFFKYSYDKTLLESTSVSYSDKTTSHTFYLLENDTTYYFRAVGETYHGIPLDTGYILLNVSFNTIPANILFQAENDYKNGYVSIRLNIKDVGYELENNNYTLKNGMLTLKDNSLSYNDGFSVEDDFILLVEAKELPLKRFLTTNSNAFSLSIINVCNVYYCKLEIKNSSYAQFVSLPKAKIITDDNKHIITDSGKMIEIIDSAYGEDVLVVFELKRVSGYYSLHTYYKSEKEI